jgi:hypothetical protein
MPEVALAVAYGEGAPADGRGDDEGTEATTILVAAVSADAPLDPTRVSQAVGDALPPPQRPVYIRRVAEIPMTEGFRPMKARLRDARSTAVLQTLRLDEARERYLDVSGAEADAAAASARAQPSAASE